MKKHKRLSPRIAGRLGSEVLGSEIGGSSVCIYGGREVTLYDCEQIIKYEHSEIVIRLREFSAVVRGCGLELDTYMGERAVIRGRIDGVEIIREDGR